MNKYLKIRNSGDRHLVATMPSGEVIPCQRILSINNNLDDEGLVEVIFSTKMPFENMDFSKEGKSPLIQGQKYVLKHSGQFCFRTGERGRMDFTENRNEGDRVKAVFVGCVNSHIGDGGRNIFITDGPPFDYLMFSSEKLDYLDEGK